MSLVTLSFVLLASINSADAMTLKDDAEVIQISADAKQMMRHENHGAPAPAKPAAKAAKPAAKPAEKASAKPPAKPAQKPDAKPQAKAGSSTKAAPAPTKTVDVHLYYETRCPDCIEFINGTLSKMWANKDLRPFLNITMNPYGNAMSIPIKDVSPGYKFWHPETTGKGWEYVHICQHGSDECMGNLIQSCVISNGKIPKDKHMELIFCMAGVPEWSIEKASYECMAKAGIDQKPIRECVNSPQGNKLFAEFGKQTQAVPGRQGTPWVMINGNNLANVGDLMRNVCEGIGSGGPGSCSPFQAKPKASPAPAAPMGDDGDFTVLPAFKRKEFAVLSPDHI